MKMRVMQWLVSLTFLGVIALGAWKFWHRPSALEGTALVAVAGLLLLGIGLVASTRRVRGLEHDASLVKERAGGPLESGIGAKALRHRAARLARQAFPEVSVRTVLVVVLAGFVMTGLLFPLALHLPRWLEWEIVLGGWWLVACVMFSVLLFRGARLSGNYTFSPRAPRPWLMDAVGNSAGNVAADGCAVLPDAEGCVAGLAAFVLVGLLVAVAWLLVELLVPLLFAALVWLTLRAVGRVLRDRHDCRSQLLRSVGYGILWATLYVGPLVAIVWGTHAILLAGR